MNDYEDAKHVGPIGVDVESIEEALRRAVAAENERVRQERLDKARMLDEGGHNDDE